MSFKVIAWDNDGKREEFDCASQREALALARGHRSPKYRTVKVGHDGDAIRHWTRTEGAHGNQWSARSTAECSR
jgi:hypothetical protein